MLALTAAWVSGLVSLKAIHERDARALGVVLGLERSPSVRTLWRAIEGTVNKRLFGTFGGHEALFRWLLPEAVKRGYGRKRTIFLADGARAIWKRQEKYPEGIAHLTGHRKPIREEFQDVPDTARQREDNGETEIFDEFSTACASISLAVAAGSPRAAPAAPTLPRTRACRAPGRCHTRCRQGPRPAAARRHLPEGNSDDPRPRP